MQNSNENVTPLPPTKPVIKATYLTAHPHPLSAPVAVMTVLFVAAISGIYWHFPEVGVWLEATPFQVFEKREYWRLVTSFLIHRDPDHLAANAFPLAILAYHLFGYFGFWIFPIGSLLMGALVTASALYTYSAHLNLLGISGLVYAMAGFWLTMFLTLDRSHPLGSRLVRAVGFALVMLVPSQVKQEVSYRAHALGFVWGLTFGFSYFLYNAKRLRSYDVIVWE